MRKVKDRCELAQKASELLTLAHDACFNAPDRDILGMSNGPFSGVNEVLRMIVTMDQQIADLKAQNERLTLKIKIQNRAT